MKIPEKERQTYKRTFLKHVQTLFNFPAIENFEGQLDMVKSFLAEHLYSVESVSEKGVLTAHTEALMITLQNQMLTVRLDAANYHGFEQFAEECQVLMELLDRLKVLTLEMVVLQKMNMYVFPKEHFSNGLIADDVEKRLYSEDFMAQGPSCTAGDYDEITVLAQRKFVEQDKKYSDSLTLTTIMQHAIPMDAAIKCLTDENRLIYSMFHWATSDWLRDVMKQE